MRYPVLVILAAFVASPAVAQAPSPSRDIKAEVAAAEAPCNAARGERAKVVCVGAANRPIVARVRPDLLSLTDALQVRLLALATDYDLRRISLQAYAAQVAVAEREFMNLVQVHNSRTTPADWLQRPTPQEMARYYPESASRVGMAGQVKLDCKVQTTGQLEDCQILEEVPDGYGFGSAALAATAIMRMRPATRDGRAVVGSVRFPLNFNMPQPAANVAPVAAAEVVAPALLEQPSASQYRRFYPVRGVRMEISGRAILSCRVSIAGTAEACAITAEAPTDIGFGDASLRMVKELRFTPQQVDGVAAEGGTIRVAFQFDRTVVNHPSPGSKIGSEILARVLTCALVRGC